MSINANTRQFSQSTGNAFLEAFHAARDYRDRQQSDEQQLKQNNLDNEYRTMQAQWQQDREVKHQEYLQGLAGETRRSNVANENIAYGNQDISDRRATAEEDYHRAVIKDVQDKMTDQSINSAWTNWRTTGAPLSALLSTLNPEAKNKIIQSFAPQAQQLNRQAAPQQTQQTQAMDAGAARGATQGAEMGAMAENPIAAAIGAAKGAAMGAGRAAGPNPIGLNAATPESFVNGYVSPSFQETQFKNDAKAESDSRKADAVEQRVAFYGQKISNDKQNHEAVNVLRQAGLDQKDRHDAMMSDVFSDRNKISEARNAIYQQSVNKKGSGSGATGIGSAARAYGQIFSSTRKALSELESDYQNATEYLKVNKTRPINHTMAKIWDERNATFGSYDRIRTNLLEDSAYQQSEQFMSRLSSSAQGVGNLKNTNISGKTTNGRPATATPPVTLRYKDLYHDLRK